MSIIIFNGSLDDSNGNDATIISLITKGTVINIEEIN